MNSSHGIIDSKHRRLSVLVLGLPVILFLLRLTSNHSYFVPAYHRKCLKYFKGVGIPLRKVYASINDWEYNNPSIISSPDNTSPIQPTLLLWPRVLIDEISLEIVESVLDLGCDRDPQIASTETLVRKALQRDSQELTNQGRFLVARRCLGVTTLRGTLEYVINHTLKKLDLSWEKLSKRCQARLLLGLYILQYEEGLGRQEDLKIGLCGSDPLSWKILNLADIEASSQHISWPSSNPSENLATRCSLPLWLAQEWINAYGLPIAESLAKLANEPGPITLRYNPLKVANRTLLIQALKKEGVEGVRPCRWSPYGLRLTEGRPPHGLWGLSNWQDGKFEIQEEGSQLIALATQAQPQQSILDLCAGNGGKTLAMAGMMQGQGKIWAYDINELRLKQLESASKRAGLQHLVRVLHSEQDLEEKLLLNKNQRAKKIDTVLVDAPCSSTGVLRRHPSLRWTLDRRQALESFPALQRQLLRQAQAYVEVSGGLLVYATCSLLPQENEQIVDWFLNEYQGKFALAPWTKEEEEVLYEAFEEVSRHHHEEKEEGGGGMQQQRQGTLLLRPDIHGTDGFYIARFRKLGN